MDADDEDLRDPEIFAVKVHLTKIQKLISRNKLQPDNRNNQRGQKKQSPESNRLFENKNANDYYPKCADTGPHRI